jgi:hypothetical protein
MVMSVTMVPGAVTGGYGDLHSERQWFINGVAVPGGTDLTLFPQYVHGDQIQAKWRIRDGLGVYGPWVSSDIVTVVDRMPVITSLSVDPPSPVMTDTVQAHVATFDPDGDAVSLAYAWTVNGVMAGGNTSTLDPSHYTANDTIGLTITPTDSFGMPGDPASAAPAVVAYNLTIDPGFPGGIPRTQGRGYQPNETVDVRIDSPSGQILDSWAVDAIGRWTWENVPLPASLPGGTHVMFGTGRSSGKVGQGLVVILAGTKITPTKFPVGATVTWAGVGFVPGETVTVRFPNGQPSSVIASSIGDAMVVLISPPEPNPGGVITGSAPSGTVTAPFSVTSVLVAPPTGVRGAVVPVSVSGFGALETVNVTFDSQTPVTGVTDSVGSLTVNLPLSGLFGKHQVYATGLGSGISLSKAITLVATMTISPKSGPRGTVVTISSGPGWKPNERLQFTVGTRGLTGKTADASGSITFTYTISALDPIGALQIKLYSPVLLQTARATFTVTA